jgi:hypothetical protein
MKFLLATLLLALAHGSIAQDDAFRVLVNKGQNAIRTGGSWTPVKIGAVLQTRDLVRVAPNGYLGLVHVSGKPLELKEAGEFAVADLAGQIKAGPGVMSKYTDFILSREAETSTNLVVTGAVHRGNEELVLFLPDARKAVFLSDDLAITWSAVPGAQHYVLQFSSMFGDPLHRVETSDTAVVVNLNAEKFKEEDNIITEVFVRDNPQKRSDPSMIKKVSPADRKRINAALEEVKAETLSESALSSLLRAAFYEEHGLLIDAATAYRMAAAAEPGVPQYREAYLAFLRRQAAVE